MTWGWDVETINPTNFREGSGFLGKYYKSWAGPPKNSFLNGVIFHSTYFGVKFHPSESHRFAYNNLENKLLLISINFTPKTSHSCLKKWYTMFSRKAFYRAPHFNNPIYISRSRRRAHDLFPSPKELTLRRIVR